MTEDRHTPILRVLLTDLFLLNIINLFFVFIIKKYTFKAPRGGEHYLLLLLLLNLLWIIINVVFTRYRLELNRGIGVEIKKILAAVLLFTGMISIFAFLFKNLYYSRLVIYGSISVFFVCLMVSHWIFFYTLRWIRKKKKIKKRVLIVGEDELAVTFANELTGNNDVDYDVLTFIDGDTLPETPVGHRLMKGKPEDVKTLLLKDKFDELFLVVSSCPGKELGKIIEIADYHGIRVRMVPCFYHLVERDFNMGPVRNIPIINVNETPLDRYYNWLYKRLFDIFFSIFALVLLSPLLIMIGMLVKLTSKGPVLYKVKRVGMGGEHFQLYKFRTMCHNAENQETLSTRENDSRVTPPGRFLRKTNLDELPQFYNVLKGDMSVVGPRPHRVYLDKKLQNEVNKYMIRHYVRPGITGWAQVNGWRGPTATEEQKIQRTRHDLWYIKNWSFRLDIKIILLTLLGKRTRKNAF